jgi:FAD/FMN-containing dehydrogenase
VRQNLVSVDLVTADGRRVTASETEHPELFWALHGGGGNFGVATAFEFRLHRVYAGLLAWPSERGRDVCWLYRDLAHDAPDDLGSGLFFLTGPPEEPFPEHLRGTTLVVIVALWAGQLDDGAEAVRPFRELAPAVDLVGPMEYADLQCMLDDPPGLCNYWSASYHEELPDDALDVFMEYGLDRRSPHTQQVLLPWGGAVARVAGDATPLAGRSARWVTHPFALWEDPVDTEANIAWARGFRRDIAPHASGGVYLNFIGDEGEDRVRAAFGGEKYAQLAVIKAEWDPENVFRGNQNIKPAH